MDTREQRGLAIAALTTIQRTSETTWLVPSQSVAGTLYEVSNDPAHPSCNCPDHTDRGIKCKHMFAVEFTRTRERKPDGTEILTRTFKVTERVTYKQIWKSYNKAQVHEKRFFVQLLRDLCAGIHEDPMPPGRGQTPYPMADRVFSSVFKVYTGLSCRRFMSDLVEVNEKGYLKSGKAPHFNSVLRYLEDPELTPILKSLVVESSKPLRAVETEFAPDSSGFATSRFVKWFDIKYGKTVQQQEWVKCHIMCGLKTNVVTAVEILDKNAADCPQFAGLLKTTAQNFDVQEVSADSAYLSAENVNAIAEIGAQAFIMPKENTTGAIGGLFRQMFHFYEFHKDEFLKHYHKRSNVESTFSMMKAKFRDHVRAKSDSGMVNEVLAKIICHNICCLIHSIFELGMAPTFWTREEIEGKAENVHAAIEQDSIDALAWV
jgi:transposase